MKIISFAWTTEALLAGVKKVTRREWSQPYAQSFKAGELIAAYDRSPRSGGKKVATILITDKPYQEYVGSANMAEYHAEGLYWMRQEGLTIQGLTPSEFWTNWQRRNPLVWVVRFKLVSVP